MAALPALPSAAWPGRSVQRYRPRISRPPLPTLRSIFLAQGPAGAGRRLCGLRALAGLTAGSWPGCAPAAAPRVRLDLCRAAREGSGRCGACGRRRVLLCARNFELRARKLFLLQLLRSPGRIAGRARALARKLMSCPEFCGPGRFSCPAHCSAGRRDARICTMTRMLSCAVGAAVWQECGGNFCQCSSCGLGTGAVPQSSAGRSVWRQKSGARLRGAAPIMELCVACARAVCADVHSAA